MSNARAGTTGEQAGSPTAANGVRIDPDFRDLGTPLSAGELAELERLLLVEGCRDALVVWQEEQILLDGHNRYALCTRHGLPYRIDYRSFPSREAAQQWLAATQMARRNATAEALSYLRGKRYQAAKGKQGGTGANQHNHAQTSQRARFAQSPAEQVAAELQVSLATLNRDDHFARQVDSLAAEFGVELRRLILSRDARLTRHAVARLVKMPQSERRVRVQALLQTKQWPRAKPNGEPPSKLVLPHEPAALAAALVRKLGPEQAGAVSRRLLALLQGAGVAEAVAGGAERGC
jgi:hypothetical protein